ncbi:MAG TPA: PDZ domain-containing protein [Clostridiaceae bacterium]|nr:PDZ domain-containing protein [Clostridiaceae bacterium]
MNNQFGSNDNQNNSNSYNDQFKYDNNQNVHHQFDLNNSAQPNNYYNPEYQNYDPNPQIELQYAEEDRIRRIVQEELRNKKPKKIWLRVIALILVGALLGTGVTYGALNILRASKKVSKEEPKPTESGVVEEVPEYTQENLQIEIDLGETSTVENVVAAKTIPAIVGITSKLRGQVQQFYFYEIPEYAEAVGSGVIVDSSGYILTNSHVVNNGSFESLTVSFSDDQETEAELIWNDQTLDLAIIKVERDNLPTVEMGDSDDVSVGDKAIAVGNPLGLSLQSTLTSGYISGLDRTIRLDDGNIMDGLIQTDAAINSGNSGGALFNAEGKIIGINTARPQTADGIGFAIPINTAKPIIEKVITEGSFESLYLGISGINVQYVFPVDGEELPTDTGVMVQEVFSDSPAAKAGIKPGDIITALGSDPVDSMNSLKTNLLKYELNDTVTITYFRGDEEKTTEITFSLFVFPNEMSKKN